ncbi:IS701 family transposase [Streptomyces sp. NPDC050535]|uniref:IS701 family transposase n=1 Tax=Streptomyces sp. NPDC050535 TaxID=3365626 RepID=UPI00378A94BC
MQSLNASLTTLSGNIFSSLRRADQRRWAEAYLLGLLVTPGKKSVRRLADAVSNSPTAAQSLRQFISISPWDWDPVMHELTHWAEGHGTPSAWTIGRAVLPKRGERSVGVHRYFDSFTGRTLNCQLGIGAFAYIGTVPVPVDWRLHLPAQWTEDPELRRGARIPDTMHYRSLQIQALDLVDTLTSRTDLTPPPVVVDLSDDPDTGLFLRALSQRGHDFVIAVPPTLRVHPVVERSPSAPAFVSAKSHLPSGGSPDTVLVTAPGGQQERVRVQSALVVVPGTRTAGLPEHPYRLFTEMLPDNRTGPLWITNLTHRRLDEVVSLTTLRTATVASVTTMERDFGLLDFEGRSLPGWYHHMALVSAAYAYRHLTPAPQSQPRRIYLPARHSRVAAKNTPQRSGASSS